MKEAQSLWQLAKAAALLSLFQLADGLPQEAARAAAREVQQAAPSPWVAVNAAGGASTFTPIVTSTNGVTTTLSQAPSYLLATGTYTLSPSGTPFTTTGLAPVATATGAVGEAGNFLACNVYQSRFTPFCQPEDGTVLYPGWTYYITWSSSYFSNASASLQVQGNYGNGEGFTSAQISVETGFFAWEIPSDFLTEMNQTSINVSLSVAWMVYGEQWDQTQVDEIAGPTVYVRAASPTTGTGAGGSVSVNPAVIAVPVVVGLLLVALLGVFCWRWRRTGTMPLFGGVARRSSQGYGVRQSKAQRVGSGSFGAVRSDKPTPNVGIQLTDRESWSPTSPGGARLGSNAEGQGRNVFREELERQEREG